MKLSKHQKEILHLIKQDGWSIHHWIAGEYSTYTIRDRDNNVYVFKRKTWDGRTIEQRSINYKTFYSLIEKGMISTVDRSGNPDYRITDKGKEAIQ